MLKRLGSEYSDIVIGKKSSNITRCNCRRQRHVQHPSSLKLGHCGFLNLHIFFPSSEAEVLKLRSSSHRGHSGSSEGPINPDRGRDRCLDSLGAGGSESEFGFSELGIIGDRSSYLVGMRTGAVAIITTIVETFKRDCGFIFCAFATRARVMLLDGL